VRQENQGLSGARNTGIRDSEGEYLMFLDADNRLLPGTLEVGLGCFDAHPECALGAGRSNIIRADGSFRMVLRHELPDEDPYVALLEKCHISPSTSAMYRRSVFETVAGFASGVHLRPTTKCISASPGTSRFVATTRLWPSTAFTVRT
jgi:glycosyltransferase involved in cell wall biosynthesis